MACDNLGIIWTNFSHWTKMIMFAAIIETVCVCSWWPHCLRSQTMQTNDVIGKHVPCPILIDNDGILFNNDRQTTAQYHVTPLISDYWISTVLHDIKYHLYVADIFYTKSTSIAETFTVGFHHTWYHIWWNPSANVSAILWLCAENIWHTYN